MSSTLVAPFDKREVLPYIGDLLGKGGFNSVYEIERIHIHHHGNDDHDDDDDDVIYDEQVRQKKEMIQQNTSKMAIKFLSKDAYHSIEDACNGSADLYMEAQYLTALTQNHPHPNIIQIHGVSNAGSSGLSKYGGYFIIIDRLYDTLDRRIDIWRELQRRKLTSNDDSDSEATQQYLKVLFIQRLLVTYEIISAVRHLHLLHVIFRDLKPDNIGFDYQNRVKIFDFGLAKELDPKQHVSNSKQALYTMSGGTGSRRFMAPEVALSQPYGLSADLYSFGIVAWEIFALEKAFGQMSVEQHKERVINGTDRPPIPSDWTIGVKEILTGCWDQDISHRPCAGTVERLIQKEISNMIAMNFPAQAMANKKKTGLKHNH
jgi:serine/threonine protein kinase